MARTGKVHKRDGIDAPLPAPPAATWKLFLVGGRLGGARTPNVTSCTTFTDGDLDVPGRPRIIPTPGHSPGHVCLPPARPRRADRGRRAVHLQPADRQARPAADAARVRRSTSLQAQASLDALERIDAGVLLFGHGEPWTDGPAAAVARAREFGLT